MFCDLVGSTALSTGMDPEDLRDVIASYQSRCSAAIRHYDGFVAKYMGDGILVYFGYPRAHEDEAERSVRAGLDIVDAMAELNAAVPQAARGRARGADRHRHRTGDRRRPDRRRNRIGDRGRRRDAEPGGASAGIGAAEPDRRQRGHARDARRSLRPRGSGGLRAEGVRRAGAGLARLVGAGCREPVCRNPDRELRHPSSGARRRWGCCCGPGTAVAAAAARSC